MDKCNTARDMNDIYDNIDSLYDIIGVYRLRHHFWTVLTVLS